MVNQLPSLKVIDVALQLNFVPSNPYFSFPDEYGIYDKMTASHPFFTMDLGFDGTIHRSLELTDRLFCVHESAIGHRCALEVFSLSADTNCIVYKGTPSDGPHTIGGLDLEVLSTGAGTVEALEAEYDRRVRGYMLSGPPDDSD